MKAVVEPFVDGRRWDSHERRCALVRFADAAVMFTASWDLPSSLVPRPDGSYRRKYVVKLLLLPEHRERSFHHVIAVTLHREGEEPVTVDDIGDVYARDLQSVTLTMYVDDWSPQEPLSAVILKPPL